MAFERRLIEARHVLLELYAKNSAPAGLLVRTPHRDATSTRHVDLLVLPGYYAQVIGGRPAAVADRRPAGRRSPVDRQSLVDRRTELGRQRVTCLPASAVPAADSAWPAAAVVVA